MECSFCHQRIGKNDNFEIYDEYVQEIVTVCGACLPPDEEEAAESRQALIDQGMSLLEAAQYSNVEFVTYQETDDY